MGALVVTAAAAREAAIISPGATGSPVSSSASAIVAPATTTASAPSDVHSALTAEDARCAGVLSHPSSFGQGAVDSCLDAIIR